MPFIIAKGTRDMKAIHNSQGDQRYEWGCTEFRLENFGDHNYRYCICRFCALTLYLQVLRSNSSIILAGSTAGPPPQLSPRLNATAAARLRSLDLSADGGRQQQQLGSRSNSGHSTVSLASRLVGVGGILVQLHLNA